MKVYYDARWILVENRFDGVSRYSHELAWSLHARTDIEVVWLVYDERQLAKLPPGEHVMVNNPHHQLAELRLPFTLNKLGAKIVYSPFFLMGTLGKRYKLVLTIHDLIYFTHRTPPQWLKWHERLAFWLFNASYVPLRWQLNQADAIATVSDTAARELIAARATTRKVTVVSNAVNPELFRDSTPRNRAEMEGVVYMGAFTPYKNVECLIDAAALVPDITLHLCGKLPSSRRPQIEARIAVHGIANRVVLYDGATDNQYRRALAQARCAMSASRLEGFGLPLIEAQQAGVPFGAADTPIFHEVGNSSVLYFDPNDPKTAAEVMRKFGNKKINQEYTARGYKNAARYTWQNSANTAIKICQSLY
ncbi:glycosyltransferase family 1 protein [Candidatus Saccharibacteria bacterium]|nr:glycosyltransferase family 1 protein [Candidatus Saccharibacteria bacterium]